MTDDLSGRMADAILNATYPPEEWPDGPPGEGEMDTAREQADAVLALIEEDPVLEIRPYYPTQDAYDAACYALEKHRKRANEAEADRDRAREIAVALEQQVARVQGMHVRAAGISEWCAHCEEQYPCPTLRALDGGEAL